MLEVELFDYLTMCFYKMCLQMIFNIWVKTGSCIKWPTVTDMP